jgi:hypothetical protein
MAIYLEKACIRDRQTNLPENATEELTLSFASSASKGARTVDM